MPGAGAINLDHTINSGQVFLWRRDGGFWYGVDGQNVLKCGPAGVVKSYRRDRDDFFRTGDDMGAITGSISRDSVVRRSVARYPGLRLLRQDPFQCCISFISSSNASIQKIRSGLEGLCRRFGERVRFDGLEFRLFPRPERLAGAPVGRIRECGLGYRSGYVSLASGMVAGGEVDLGAMRAMGYGAAKERLLAMPGIGNKVADCILLFSLDKPEAFPLDRWVIKVLQKYYPEKFGIPAGSVTGRQYGLLHGRIVDHFGPYAGYAQQFLFKMEREDGGKKWL